jgi:CxxC motif-containing protein
MATRKLTCISCPMGCRLEVEYAQTITSIQNNRCKNGIKYAENEIYDPRRMVTTTVLTTQPIKYLPVKTAAPIPKKLVKNVIEELKAITVTHPVKIGDVIKENICGTQINIIATMNS